MDDTHVYLNGNILTFQQYYYYIITYEYGKVKISLTFCPHNRNNIESIISFNIENLPTKQIKNMLKGYLGCYNGLFKTNNFICKNFILVFGRKTITIIHA